MSPSARPRNSENEPRVTIKGGNPAAGDQEPVDTARQRAEYQGHARRPADRQPGSRQSLPKTTAERPISEPTERSMPPLVITGVKATASRPISTLSRSTSKALPSVKKLVPIAEKTATSSKRRARIAERATACGGLAISAGVDRSVS